MAVEGAGKVIEIEKGKTGIDGLDQITGGGVPKGGKWGQDCKVAKLR